MKNRSISRVVMLAVMMLASVSAFAQYVVCTGDNVRLRTGPSTQYPMLVWTSNDKPVYIDKGETLTYLGNDTPEFYNVEFDGKSVYISKKYAKLVKADKKADKKSDKKVEKKASDSKAKSVVVAGDNVRLRWEASLEGKIYSNSKGKAIYPSKGAKLTYLGEEGNFFKVKYKGNVLYISKDYSYLK